MMGKRPTNSGIKPNWMRSTCSAFCSVSSGSASAPEPLCIRARTWKGAFMRWPDQQLTGQGVGETPGRRVSCVSNVDGIAHVMRMRLQGSYIVTMPAD